MRSSSSSVGRSEILPSVVPIEREPVFGPDVSPPDQQSHRQGRGDEAPAAQFTARSDATASSDAAPTDLARGGMVADRPSFRRSAACPIRDPRSPVSQGGPGNSCDSSRSVPGASDPASNSMLGVQQLGLVVVLALDRRRDRSVPSKSPAQPRSSSLRRWRQPRFRR